MNDKKLLITGLFLSILSGLTFTIVSFTIPYQLTEAGYSAHYIGILFLGALPYCLKPVWAPFIDRYSIPVLCNKFGQRRGWLLTLQLLLLFFNIGFLIIDPSSNIYLTTIIIFIISITSSSQDIIIDAYRIENSPTQEALTIFSTYCVIGFRIGMLFASAGAICIAHIFSWYVVYLTIIIITLMGLIMVFYAKESTIKDTQILNSNILSLKQYFQTLQESIVMLKTNHPSWKLILLFIFLYKASDAIPMAMSSLFFIDMSFTSFEISSISKAYGLLFMILGAFVGGIIVLKSGTFKGIMICGSLQLLSPFMFLLLSVTEHNISMFIITVTIQNFCCGLGGTALTIYLSGLCNSNFIATQFAIISSFGSLARILLSFLASCIVDCFEWWNFYCINLLLGMFFIIVFYKITILSNCKSIHC